MQKLFIHLILCLFILPALQAQQEITLEDIWQKRTFRAKSVPGFNFQKDGKHYTRLESGRIVQYDLTTGEPSDTILDAEALKTREFSGHLDGYRFSDDEKKILLKTGTERIYRRSTRANFFVWDRQKETMQVLFPEGKQMYARFNPRGTKVAFVFENNLYVRDLKSGNVKQITDDGAENAIINGATDWVYEEEFALAKAFEWSPDGEKIAFLRFDERRVAEFTMTLYHDELYPEYETFKYPKVGEKNAIVTVHIHDLKKDKTIQAKTGKETDIYFPRIKWTRDPDQLCIFRMNRHQNHLELLLANAKNGVTKTLMEEKSKYYIDIHDNLTFLEDGEHFVWTSERDGFNHIYLYNLSGEMKKQLTKGSWVVTEFYGVDEKRGQVYFQAAKTSPLNREIYAVSLDDAQLRLMAGKPGVNYAQFSSTFDYYVRNYSHANRAPDYTVFTNEGDQLRVIEDNVELGEKMESYGATSLEFFKFQTRDSVWLNGYMIKPPDFDASKQYPVLMYVYGGPGSQTVLNSYRGTNYWWFQMMAQKGYIVVSVDNRGTGARGVEFKKMTYLQLGKYETIDQTEAARYLGSLSYIDARRIGIFGWSYGGYMSSLCVLKSNDVFNTAIAVAPVTNWKWYDTIYTERYMRTTEENPDGYRQNSPVYFAEGLKGNYLLVHGMADDNVHFQHTVEMANALIRCNKQFDTYYYPNRNHGIYGQNARIHLYTKMTDFLDEHLLDQQAGEKTRP